MSKRFTKPKRTESQARAVYRIHEALARLEFDLHDAIRWYNHIPAEWSDLHLNRTPVQKKITLRIDEDILKYLKSLGPGYQRRMNSVMRAWVETKVAKMITDEAAITRQRETEWDTLGRPVWSGMDEEEDKTG